MTDNGQFTTPTGIAVDLKGNIYVVDYYNNRIQKFDNNGSFISKWGTEGKADGQFSLPTGIDLDSTGNVYVVDYNNLRIQVFAPVKENTSVNESDKNGSETIIPENITSLKDRNSSLSEMPSGITSQF